VLAKRSLAATMSPQPGHLNYGQSLEVGDRGFGASQLVASSRLASQ
jgi:hypothetical protein